MEKTQREKSLHFVPRLTSSSRRVENEKKKEEEKKIRRRRRRASDRGHSFTVGRANGPVIFHDALTSPLLSSLSATRSSETKVENQSPPYLLTVNFGVVVTQATTWNRDDLIIDRPYFISSIIERLAVQRSIVIREKDRSSCM